ncbi:YcaO-like family protein [Nocardiopsis exhalans]|uniref:YcaO-like family protein n=1 Tax=Nocardiopsis exhalans TaxID=163604 RepID=A0ABY5D147_9ACTN|nr:YcaO-like family protein [Nocardiopsis exhalans]USY17238.1 YcaO-like family protein [Nocardiopsis exhalans]
MSNTARSALPRRPLTDLVDARSGLVHSLVPEPLHPSLPPALHLVAAHPNTRHGGGARGQATPGGAAWWDRAAAEAAALGEAVERHCADSVPVERRSRWSDLAAEGVAAVDPASLALYSDQQYDAPGFPFVRFDRDLTVAWTRGYSVPEQEPVLVPTSLIGLGAVEGQPLTHLPVNAGVAAATDVDGARLSALEEVLERHCLATAWEFGTAFDPLPVPPWLTGVLGGDAAAQECFVWSVPNEFGLPVAAVLLRDRRDGVLGMGTALRPRTDAAVAKAAAEAVVSCQAARRLCDEREMGALFEEQPDTVLRPWRAQRDYARAYRSDLRDLVDVSCHVQYHLDPGVWPELSACLGSGTHPEGWSASREAADRAAYPGIVRERGYRVVAVDLTTPDVASCGLAVARAVVPGLRATAPAAFPMLGGSRPCPPERSLPHLRPLPLPHA